uniref:Alpha-carbonic anhydrase domain-containing protein n=1 Tax=Anopheles atroparvus TaxID=41427 RepID=A0AAG5DLM2_ANOAO
MKTNQTPNSSSIVAVKNAELVQSLAANESRLPSPIDLDVRWAQQIELAGMQWKNYDVLPASVELTNTGETVSLSARWYPGSRPSICGGPLANRRYVFSDLHFHWGRTALEGSEHTVDGLRMPLELHMVHFDKKLGDREAARSVPGGLLCVVYLFRLQPAASPFFAPIVAGLGRVLFPGSQVKLDPFPLSTLVHTFCDEYFLYWGSIRSPASSNPRLVQMLWMVSRAQERLSFAQLKRFNLLLDHRMRLLEPSPSTSVIPVPGRHLFHVNPRTPMARATLSHVPPPKYSQTRWPEQNAATEIVMLR